MISRPHACAAVALLCAVAALAACTAGPPAYGYRSTAPAPRESTGGASQEGMKGAIPQETTRVAARPDAPPPGPPPPEPAMLAGLSEAEVTQLIGAPRFRRLDAPAALWQYRSGDCLLDLYLRADGATYRVRHFEFRPAPRTQASSERPDARACLARLARTGAGRETAR